MSRGPGYVAWNRLAEHVDDAIAVGRRLLELGFLVLT
jgi:hypothetical protein